MKTILKILAFSFIVISMASCETHYHTDEHLFPYDPETLQKLHNNIRPSKPIKIPDTLRILTADPALYIITQDSVPQDTTPQDSIN